MKHFVSPPHATKMFFIAFPAFVIRLVKHMSDHNKTLKGIASDRRRNTCPNRHPTSFITSYNGLLTRSCKSI